ncbi:MULTISPECIES: hypothetical protein [Brevibacillus]|jgi:hypothetical protein|uniref:Uncharacterized protein n=1 Tax=Brevibacillus parabrevis TaxID=54914 RepID=A0A4Y3PU98_BREPA|nr:MULTISPECIES: hypothetical protein [Brevibacillus]TGV16932.1 hypothetical protein EN829_048035 [Mesorhizobium sp. M00.F.Ca.ET.186.01.1.1]MBU8715498.1 hypothetical protein [Brevibacillus parabrevis]MDH6352108.1 hypothetical protein [Brevibacillus sp. 1238]MDR4999015.1 hypothetical protein [Brevibacillus parabrevis]MED1725733.1 hypothetical protein [Brevibacillus parabrevis]
MKRSYRGVLLLCLVLFANLICTQYTVNLFYFARYEEVIGLSVVNLLLFPLAVFLYRKEGRSHE